MERREGLRRGGELAPGMNSWLAHRDPMLWLGGWRILAPSTDPPATGPVCPVVWEGGGREAPPYPD
jgi:hypothetical protein